MSEKTELAIDCVRLCAFPASGVVSVASQVMGFPFVRQLKVKNVLQAMHQPCIADREEDLDAMTQVAPHEVSTAEIKFLHSAVPKIIDTAML